MHLKKLSWLIAGLFAMPWSGAALAQEAAPASAPAADGPIQQVQVSGIRSSVRNALAAKEASNSMVEVIASEDIGKLPDTTIAESLARLPGLSSGMDRGNASQIVARGLGPRFIGATLNGRELASSEPNRAVRFEQFPSESISGATVYKTQEAELVEGGIATTINLQTVSPLKYSGRQLNLKADALYYEIARDIPGAPNTRPRLGGIYVDQFADKSIGLALAFSYQDQPSVQKNVAQWGFNEDHSVDLNGDGKIDKAPWGFADAVTRGTNKRASALAKVEWKLSPGNQVTADVYYAQDKIREPGLAHWTGDLGNWDGANSANFSNVDVRNGYIAGASVANVYMSTHDTLWTQNMDNLAGGLNGRFSVGDWKIEADASISKAGRDSAWRDLRQYSSNGGTTTFAFTGNRNPSFDYGIDTGNPAAFGAPSMVIDTDGHLDDKLSGFQLSAARSSDWGPVSQLKVGLRATDREKSYHQTTWTVQPLASIPNSAYETISVDGRPAYLALKDFMGTASSAFGSSVFDPSGRTPTANDLLSGWRVKERSSAAYVQADLNGDLFGKTFRGNAGLRVVHTSQTGEGMQSLNGAAPTPGSDGTSYTEILPSLNLIFNMDAQQQKQIRFSIARAMSRAPLDELRASRAIYRDDANPNMPLSGSAGNPQLKPMMANQVDLAYQWYFARGSLLSGGLFYKKLTRYIGITQDPVSLAGRAGMVTRSVNGEGGNIRGAELVYQQLFANGFGVAANYAYTASSVKEFIPTVNPYPIEGLMKHNGGLTAWYENSGYEARMYVNAHSPFVRNPTWGAGALIMNGSEKWVGLALARQLTPKLQLRFGLDNLTNQKVVYTAADNPLQQEVTEFGRRLNVGLSLKM